MSTQVNGRSYDNDFVEQLRQMEAEQTEKLLKAQLANEKNLTEAAERESHRRAILNVFEATMLALRSVQPDEVGIEKVLRVPE